MPPKDPNFDARESERRKDEGMGIAAEKRAKDLHTARQIAIHLARTQGSVTADDVQRFLKMYGINLGPAAGSIFKTDDFEFTGERRRSEQVRNHAREQYIWRLRERED